MTDHEMRELFREMRDEPIPADSLVRVRAGVDQRRRRLALWKIGVPMALAAMCAVAFMMFRPAVPVRQVPPPVISAMPAPNLTPETPVRIASRPRRARPRTVAAAPVLIRIETPDPDVVILLVN